MTDEKKARRAAQVKENLKRWRENNKDKVKLYNAKAREYRGDWLEKNKERVKNYRKKYWEKYPEKLKAQNEKLALKNKVYRAENLELVRNIERVRYANNRQYFIEASGRSRDKKNPGRVIRRASRQFKRGDIGRDEFINRIIEVIGLKDA